MDHRDPEPERRGTILNSHHAPVELDAPRISLVDTCKHLHERRLARAVLAHQCVHGSGLDIKVDIVERLNTGKCLPNPRHPEKNVLTHALQLRHSLYSGNTRLHPDGDIGSK